MLVTSRISDYGYDARLMRSSGAQVLLSNYAREFSSDHHPVAVMLFGAFGLSFTALVCISLGADEYAAAMIPLMVILAMAFNALFWTYGRVLASPVEGLDAALAHEFHFSEQAQRLIDARRTRGLPVRGLDLWMALAAHKRASDWI